MEVDEPGSREEVEVRVEETEEETGGILVHLRSWWRNYYLYSPFWAAVVVFASVVDLLLALWCLVYALFYSSNPFLTLLGGFMVCGLLADVIRYAYRRTRPPVAKKSDQQSGGAVDGFGH